MSVSDRIHTSLVSYGGSTIDERVYNYLGSLGFTGTISDRLAKYNHNGKKGWQAIIEGFGLSLSAGFVRQELFGESQQGVLYVSQPSYLGQQVLYQDAAGTIPVTADGDPVGLRLDLSGNGNHIAAPTSAQRPLYRTDGVRHWLQWDGVDDVLRTAGAVDFTGTDAVTCCLAIDKLNDEAAIIVEQSSSSRGFASINGSSFRARSGGDTSRDANVSGFEAPISAVATGRAKIGTPLVEARFNRGEWAQNTGDQGVGNYPDAVLDIGARGSAANVPFAGNDYGIVIVGEFLSDANTERLESYLANLAGITL